jgi:hypothetical protein
MSYEDLILYSCASGRPQLFLNKGGALASFRATLQLQLAQARCVFSLNRILFFYMSQGKVSPTCLDHPDF